MLKKHWKMMLITSIITVLPILAGLFLWNKLPDSLPTHFDAAGNPDGWSSKLFAVVGLPLFLLAMHWLCVVMTLADPKRKNISDKIIGLIIWIIPVVSIFCGLLTYGAALGFSISVNKLISVLIGFVFIVSGAMLPRCKQNYTVGIKVPWALHYEDNWEHTHRFAGKIWIAGGIAFTVVSLFTSPVIGSFILIPIALAPIIYSYVYYLKFNKE